MATLYEIEQELQALNDALEQLGGDISEAAVEQAFDEWFARLGAQIEEKTDAYCKLIREYEARAQARAEEAARLAELAKADTKAADRLKTRLKAFMETTGKGKLETTHFKLAVQKNGGKPPLVLPEAWKQEPATAPEAFHKKTISLDTDAIRAALEAGVDIAGCEIGERGTHLRLR